jgi:hypothetical protein
MKRGSWLATHVPVVDAREIAVRVLKGDRAFDLFVERKLGSSAGRIRRGCAVLIGGFRVPHLDNRSA